MHNFIIITRINITIENLYSPQKVERTNKKQK